jgi:hypothetical protein
MGKGFNQGTNRCVLKEIRPDTEEKGQGLGGWEVNPSFTLSTDTFLTASILQPGGDPHHLDGTKSLNESN